MQFAVEPPNDHPAVAARVLFFRTERAEKAAREETCFGIDSVLRSGGVLGSVCDVPSMQGILRIPNSHALGAEGHRQNAERGRIAAPLFASGCKRQPLHSISEGILCLCKHTPQWRRARTSISLRPASYP